MNNEMLMGVGNRRTDFAKKLQSLGDGQFLLVAIVIETRALDVFHREKWNPINAYATAVKLRDVLMIQTGEQMFFALEVTDDVVRIHAAANKLECDLAMQLSIFRQINFAHAAAPDERDNLVFANSLTGTVCALADERLRREVQRRHFDESACAPLPPGKRFH